MAAQMPPARNPPIMTIGKTRKGGTPPRLTPSTVAVRAPARSCPSAPIFQNLARNAKATARPVNKSGLAGLAGVGELCAIQYRLIMDISPGYGYSGIVIAMLGNLHPVGVLFSSLFFSVVIVGAQTMSRMTGVPSYIAEVIQGMSLMVMLIFLLFTEYKIKMTIKGSSPKKVGAKTVAPSDLR